MGYMISYIGKRIKEKRLEKKFTQQELADMLCIRRQTVIDIEKEMIPERSFKLSTLLNVCNILDTDIDYLLGIQDKPKATISNATETTGLRYETIEKLSALDPFQKKIIDALCNSKNESGKTGIDLLLGSLEIYAMSGYTTKGKFKNELLNFEMNIPEPNKTPAESFRETSAFLKAALNKKFDEILDIVFHSNECEQERNRITDQIMKNLRDENKKLKQERDALISEKRTGFQ